MSNSHPEFQSDTALYRKNTADNLRRLAWSVDGYNSTLLRPAENTADNLRAAVWSTRAIRTGPVTALDNSVGGKATEKALASLDEDSALGPDLVPTLTVMFCLFLVLLTSVSNTNKEKVQTGAAHADIQLQALQHNKRRERDITVTWEHL